MDITRRAQIKEPVRLDSWSLIKLRCARKRDLKHIPATDMVPGSALVELPVGGRVSMIECLDICDLVLAGACESGQTRENDGFYELAS